LTQVDDPEFFHNYYFVGTAEEDDGIAMQEKINIES
jgi:hypothetical protein